MSITKKRPNIILFLADQLRFDALGCYGNNEIHTPNIDSLALNGSTFDNHFIQNPVCSPSRCTILTGRYPRNHGTRDNGIPLRDQEVCFPEVCCGKTATVPRQSEKCILRRSLFRRKNEEDDWPEDHYGFDVIHTTCDTKTGEYLTWLKERSQKDYEVVKMQGERKAKEDRASASEKDTSGPPQVYPSEINPEYHQSAWIADRTIDLIREADPNQPFFRSVQFCGPASSLRSACALFYDV